MCHGLMTPDWELPDLRRSQSHLAVCRQALYRQRSSLFLSPSPSTGDLEAKSRGGLIKAQRLLSPVVAVATETVRARYRYPRASPISLIHHHSSSSGTTQPKPNPGQNTNGTHTKPSSSSFSPFYSPAAPVTTTAPFRLRCHMFLSTRLQPLRPPELLFILPFLNPARPPAAMMFSGIALNPMPTAAVIADGAIARRRARETVSGRVHLLKNSRHLANIDRRGSTGSDSGSSTSGSGSSTSSRCVAVPSHFSKSSENKYS
ncbi:hypothetical protein JOL62DRAFT_111850 [Phyllosticta paracitricarpa]|uniref:Uncharacterized protein n=1 Tax=Phyllosticta paracitricarpa TaxID=2016321 RepID=A0ABR1N550_9PEZI